MTLIDKKYQKQLQQLHNDGRFNNGRKAYRIVKNFIETYHPTSVLDFGCEIGRAHV